MKPYEKYKQEQCEMDDLDTQIKASQLHTKQLVERRAALLENATEPKTLLKSELDKLGIKYQNVFGPDVAALIQFVHLSE